MGKVSGKDIASKESGSSLPKLIVHGSTVTAVESERVMLSGQDSIITSNVTVETDVEQSDMKYHSSDTLRKSQQQTEGVKEVLGTTRALKRGEGEQANKKRNITKSSTNDIRIYL